MVEEQKRKEIVKKELAALVNSAKTRALLITKLASAGSLLLEAAALGIDLSEIANAADAKVKTYENIKVQEQISEDQARSEEMQSLEKLRLLEVATFLAESERLDKQHVEFKKEVSLHIDTLEQNVNKVEEVSSYLKDKNIKGRDIDFSKFVGVILNSEEIEKLNKERKSLEKHKKEIKDHNKLLREHNAKLVAERIELEKLITEQREEIGTGKYSSAELPRIYEKVKLLESEKLKIDKHIEVLAPVMAKGKEQEIEVDRKFDYLEARDARIGSIKEVLNKEKDEYKHKDPEKNEVINDFLSLLENQEAATKSDVVNKDKEQRDKFVGKVAAAVEAKKEGGRKEKLKIR